MLYLFAQLLIGLLIGLAAAPIARRLGHAYGRFGRAGDLLAVVVGAVVGAVLFSAVMGALGSIALRDAGWLMGAIPGAVIVAVLLSVSAKNRTGAA